MLLFVLKLVIYYQLFYYYVVHELVTKSFSYYITMEQNIQTATFAIAPLLCVYTDTHARTQMHTHTFTGIHVLTDQSPKRHWPRSIHLFTRKHTPSQLVCLRVLTWF